MSQLSLLPQQRPIPRRYSVGQWVRQPGRRGQVKAVWESKGPWQPYYLVRWQGGAKSVVRWWQVEI